MNAKQTDLELLDDYFYSYDELMEQMEKEIKGQFSRELLDKFIDKGLIVPLFEDGEKCFQREDIGICKRLLLLNVRFSAEDYAFVGYDGNIFIDRVKLGEGTYVSYPLEDNHRQFPVLVRNIIYLFADKYKQGEERKYDLSGISVVTDNCYVSEYISNALYRMYRLNRIKSSSFANSSVYMGSKKDIIGFIVESIWPHCSDDTCILDIMCGSGAASNAFAQMGKVYSSDAQEFCRVLAKVQGYGFDVYHAEELLNKLHVCYFDNLQKLQKMCSRILLEEDRIFHMDTKDREILTETYLNMISEFELYSSTRQISDNIQQMIDCRRKNPKEMPYCLFTYYFSNVYFGIEQSMQIDSIRYAIDAIQEERYRDWLLGVLVITVSAVASNYAGHFAQPKKIDSSSICSMIEMRKRSVWLEFSKRLVAIAEESEKYSNEITLINGPWENAILEMKYRNEKNLAVYLDAPYKRDEYSRYYHVLETVVKYDYPSSERKGCMRSIEKGERFRSVFSSRNVKVVEAYFVKMILEILEVAQVCAWSYSNNGVVDMVHVINQIKAKTSCMVYIYSTPHRHVAQGRKRDKGKKLDVIEYCIVFVRNI